MPDQFNKQNIPQESQPSFQPEPPKKFSLPAWASILIAAVAIIVVSLAGWAAYRAFVSRPTELPNESPEGKQVSPLPAAGEIAPADETTNWQTYRNEEYGFEARYPGDWVIEKDTIYPFGVALMPKDFQRDKRDMRLTIDPLNVGRESVFDSGANPPCEIKSITFANLEAEECIYDSNFGLMDGRFIRFTDLKDTNWQTWNEVGFSLRKEYNHLVPIYNQILSTFKFTK